MNIIFIHGNFPGQFKHLLFNLAEVDGIETYFLTEKDNQGSEIVKVEKLEPHRSASSSTHHYLTTTEECVLRGQAVIRKLIELEERGISIDIVICHGGMGYGLFIKDLRPNTIVISYNEWYFTQEKFRSFVFRLYL